jgi:uncharacterized protein YbjT (DUF2867 family)
MDVVVTGGTGTQGLAICQRLVADGHKVRALTRRATPKNPQLPESVQLVQGDLDQPEALADAFFGCDAAVLVQHSFCKFPAPV